MTPLPRRAFLKSSLLLAGAAAAPWRSVHAQPRGANDAVRIGILGLGNKGAAHLKDLASVAGARVVALCDVDPAVLRKAAATAPGVFTSTDPRRVLERADVDAVVVATPNHWHALLTVWACQAGKDVYVEKPMSRTVAEGRQMVAAARRYDRVVQVGTQYLSERGLREAKAWLDEGHLGRIRHVHTVAHRPRGGIGRRRPWYPEGLDYDLFCGPAPMEPLRRDELHYDWHWMWSTGNGDLGNNGIHVIGAGLMFAGHAAPPRRVLGLGGRFGVDDVAETPNTMVTLYDYADIPVTFEFRNLPAKPGVNYADQYHGQRTGIVVHCEGGHFAGLVGGAAYDREGKRVRAFEGDGGKGHMANFLAAVRSRRRDDLAAAVDRGHVPTVLCHYGNISYRLGAKARFGDVRRAVESVPGLPDFAGDLKAHLATHGIDTEGPQLTLGPWLDLAGDDLVKVASDRADALEHGRYLLEETARPPYRLPELA
jgi:hypothetical protein